MNIFKGCLSTFYIPILLILGAILGFGVGIILMAKGIMPSWITYEIDTNNLNIEELVFIEPYSERNTHGVRIPKDTIYVRTVDDQIYSFSMENESWQLVDADSPPTDRSSSCSKEWMYPPIEHPIKDDEGGLMERPLMTETICFVLLENGRFQYWYHRLDILSMMTVLSISTFLGVILGIMASIYFRKRKIRNSKRKLATPLIYKPSGG